MSNSYIKRQDVLHAIEKLDASPDFTPDYYGALAALRGDVEELPTYQMPLEPFNPKGCGKWVDDGGTGFKCGDQQSGDESPSLCSACKDGPIIVTPIPFNPDREESQHQWAVDKVRVTGGSYKILLELIKVTPDMATADKFVAAALEMGRCPLDLWETCKPFFQGVEGRQRSININSAFGPFNPPNSH